MTRPLQLGYTGTQAGMTRAQFEGVWSLVNNYEFYGRHGCCVGGDHDFDRLVRFAPGFQGMHVHPCTLIEKQAQLDLSPRDHVYRVKPPLDRNRDIVDASDVMVATPKEHQEQLRSGTWATVRYARKVQKPLVLIYPDGSYVFENVVPGYP